MCLKLNDASIAISYRWIVKDSDKSNLKYAYINAAFKSIS